MTWFRSCRSQYPPLEIWPPLSPCARRSSAKILYPSSPNIGAHAIAPTFASAYPCSRITLLLEAFRAIHHAAICSDFFVNSSRTVKFTGVNDNPRSSGVRRLSSHAALPSLIRGGRSRNRAIRYARLARRISRPASSTKISRRKTIQECILRQRHLQSRQRLRRECV